MAGAPHPITVVQTLRDSCSQPGTPSLAFPGTHQAPNPAPELGAAKGPLPVLLPPPHPPGAGQEGSLTIMFSRAYLASQQFRNTGMNKFRKGGQNICKNKGYSQKNPCSFKK